MQNFRVVLSMIKSIIIEIIGEGGGIQHIRRRNQILISLEVSSWSASYRLPFVFFLVFLIFLFLYN